MTYKKRKIELALESVIDWDLERYDFHTFLPLYLKYNIKLKQHYYNHFISFIKPIQKTLNINHKFLNCNICKNNLCRCKFSCKCSKYKSNICFKSIIIRKCRRCKKIGVNNKYIYNYFIKTTNYKFVPLKYIFETYKPSDLALV